MLNDYLKNTLTLLLSLEILHSESNKDVLELCMHLCLFLNVNDACMSMYVCVCVCVSVCVCECV